MLLEALVLMDGVKSLVLLQLVDLLVIMLDVILLNPQLTKFLTVEHVGWYLVIRKMALMVLLIESYGSVSCSLRKRGVRVQW